MSADDLKSRTHLLENEIRIMRSEVQRINHSVQTLKERIKENNERIKVDLVLVSIIYHLSFIFFFRQKILIENFSKL